MDRESWGSRFGFMLAAVGSAVGLANIVRFPYLVGKNGGAAFIMVYIACLIIIGFPVFISEVLIGRTTHRNPCGAFTQLGGNRMWRHCGRAVILTGFIVSSFYSALAGWILGYVIEAFQGNLTHFEATTASVSHYNDLMSSPLWGIGYHAAFMLTCAGVLYTGVRTGLERASKAFMPLMLAVLIYLVITGLRLPNSEQGLIFLLAPDWSAITPTVILMALGQSFFTLSVGQGTMITYGSYLKKETNLIASCVPIVVADTVISIMAAIVVFCIVFSAGMEPDAGLGLIFHTLPVVFSKIASGYWVALAFFILVALAALTSEISAMEPAIAYLVDEKGWKRQKAVVACGLGAFVIGIPSALSFSLLKNVTIADLAIIEVLDFVTTGIMIPVGGLLAVILVGWRWGIPSMLTELSFGGRGLLEHSKILRAYFTVCIKYLAPIIILMIAVKALFMP